MLNKNINIVSKTLILGAHEAIPCAPEVGHINGQKTNKLKDRYGQKWIETKEKKLIKNTQKKTETNIKKQT